MKKILSPRVVLSLLLVCVGGALTVFGSLVVKQSIEDELRRELDHIADATTLRIEERLEAYALVLKAGAGLFDGSEEVERHEWRAFVERLDAGATLGHIQGIGFSKLISAEDLEEHERRVQAEGFPDYQVRPPGLRSVYSSIIFLEPFDQRNRRAFGFDMFAEPVRRAAMERARDTGRAAFSGRVKLQQETDTDIQPGTLMYVPVYHREMPLDTVEDRRQALLGWVYSPYRMQDLMEGILSDWVPLDRSEMRITLYDQTEPGAGQLLFRSRSPDGAEYNDAWSRERVIQAKGRRWSLSFTPSAESVGGPQPQVWAVAVGGATMSGLMGALLLSLSTSHSRAVAMAQHLTAAIRRRERELDALLTRLRTIAERVPGVVYEYRLHPDGRSCFPYASEGMERIYGVRPETVEHDASAVIETLHPEDRPRIEATIRESADALTPWREEYRVCLRDGTERWLYGNAAPQQESSGVVTWFGVITDVTERKQADQAIRRLHAENSRFREALDHVGSFIYMKDRYSRYTYANRATLELFDCTASELPGSGDQRFFPERTVMRLRSIDRRVLAGEQTTEEVVVDGTDGRRRVYLEIKTPIRDGEEIIGLLGISTDITEIKEHERQLEKLAHYDSLTGLPNRVLLGDRLQQAIEGQPRRQSRLAVVYLDIDGFKAINDQFGHAVGDQFLAELAARLQVAIRKGDTLSRLGGDEFVAVLLDVADDQHTEQLLDRLLDASAEPFFHHGHEVTVSASIGVTFFPQDEPVEADQLLRQADWSMYQAKIGGKNRYHVFDPDQDRMVRTQREELERIQQALDDQEFVLYYQPKVNMRSGEVIGVEALVRWQHPEYGLLPPGRFLPLIEEHPLAELLGEWVMRTVLAQAAAWRREGLRLPVSVNVGARELRRPDLLELLRSLLAEQPTVPPGDLELEVLETSALGDLAAITVRLEACRELGVQVSIDDFGTGYSSLTYLKQLPAGVVKIDQSFVRNILRQPEDMKILDGVLGLAGAFERKVVAEGVETANHGDLLLRLGCERGQGYGIARPMPAEDVPDWVAGWRTPDRWAGVQRTKRPHLPLLYASVEMRAWVDRFERALSEQYAEWPELDPNHCGFCGWFRRLKPESVKLHGRIDALHRALHARGKELHDLWVRGAVEQACERLPEMHRIRDELLEVLDEALS